MLSTNLGTSKEKLTKLYTLTRQLNYGASQAVKCVRNWKNPPRRLSELLKELSTVPQRLQQWKLSACHQGAMRTLALAFAYNPEMKPDQLVGGFPEYNADNNKFDESDFCQVEKATRPFACQIDESMDLSHFQFGYNARNRRIVTKNPKPLSLLTIHQAGTPPAPTAEPSFSTPA